MFIHFITGRGKHVNPKGDRGVLFKKLPHWLKDESIYHFIKGWKSNLGVYEVNLNPKHSLLHYETNAEQIPKARALEASESPYRQGLRYYKGKDVKQDYKKAARLFRIAANQGESDAQHKLGYLHAMGLGAVYNPQQSLKWYRKAAAQGNVASQLNIGHMYWIGEGVKQDFDQAIHWYAQAAAQESYLAKRNLGILYFSRKDYVNAFRWNMEASLQGDACAQVNLGCMYKEGLGVERDPQEAIYWFRRSAKQDNPEGQMRLGGAYYETDQKPVKTVKLLLKAALKGEGPIRSDAQYFLSRLYGEGRGVKKNVDISHKLLSQAAAGGHRQAQFEWGFECRLRGNYKDAFKWLHESAANGYPTAFHEIGFMYQQGFGVKKNEKKALSYYKKAADLGYVFSQLLLGYSTPEVESLIRLASSKEVTEITAVEARHGVCFFPLPPSIPASEGLESNLNSEQIEIKEDSTPSRIGFGSTAQEIETNAISFDCPSTLTDNSKEEGFEDMLPQEAWEPSWILSILYNGLLSFFKAA